MTASSKQMGFYVNLDNCTGCKACQIACKSKNGLSTDTLWRRVVEVVGGDWKKRGSAWLQQIATYNVPVSCMHCRRPICAEVCPTKAMHAREDGVVLVDDRLCMGCSYCEMACPYGAPTLDHARGVMGKCNFCTDNIDEGKPPECVAACQMRVIEYGPIDELRDKHGDTDVVFPLPDQDFTEPSVVFTPHREAGDDSIALVISNREELK